MDNCGSRSFVDPVVVPVDEEDQVREPQPPGRVLGLVRRTRCQAAFAFDNEDFDLLGAGELEGQRLACGEGHAVARRTRVGLEEEGPAGHLGVARQPAAMPQPEKVLPRQREAAVARKGEPGIAAGAFAVGARSEPLVEDGEGGIDERHDVTRREHEAITESAPRLPQVPAHRPREQQRQQHVDLGPRAARMPALTVVQREVDALVDQVLEDLVSCELGLGAAHQRIDVDVASRPPDRVHGHPPWTEPPLGPSRRCPGAGVRVVPS